MSVSNLPAAAFARAGGVVSCRHYVAKHRCPFCGKRYAKPTLFMAHVKGHTKKD